MKLSHGIQILHIFFLHYAPSQNLIILESFLNFFLILRRITNISSVVLINTYVYKKSPVLTNIFT